MLPVLMPPGFAPGTYPQPPRLACALWALSPHLALAIPLGPFAAGASLPRTRLAFLWNALCAWAITRLRPSYCVTIWIPSCRRRPLHGFSLIVSFPLRVPSPCRFHRSRFLLAIRARPP